MRSNADPGAPFRHAGARHTVPSRRAGVGRTHWISPRAGQELATDAAFGSLTLALLMAGGLVWQLGAVHRHALRRRGGTRPPGACGRRGRHAVPPGRRADRAPPCASSTTCAQASSTSSSCGELARSLRLRHRPGRGHAQRLRAHERPVLAHRAELGGRRGDQRCARQRFVISGALGRARIRERRAGRHRALDRGAVHRAAAAAQRREIAQEPLGIYVNGLSSRELDATEGAKKP